MMKEEEPIVNRVASSGLLVLDMEELFPIPEVVELDIRPWLFEDIILKEKEYREHIKNHDWGKYSGKLVAFFCSSDAIIPKWAYMLVVRELSGIAVSVFLGNREYSIRQFIWQQAIAFDGSFYAGSKVIIKGCSSAQFDESIYVILTDKLIPHVSSLMYGEPCSTVPVFKRKG